jgi:hypothetical protein
MTNLIESNSKLESHLYEMCKKAYASPIKYKMASCFTYCGRIVGDIHYNDYGTICKGKECTSIHAERNAMLKNPFGIQLRFAPHIKRWYCLKGKDR